MSPEYWWLRMLDQATRMPSRIDRVARADAQTSMCELRTARLIACGVDPNEITNLGYRVDQWQAYVAGGAQ